MVEDYFNEFDNLFKIEIKKNTEQIDEFSLENISDNPPTALTVNENNDNDNSNNQINVIQNEIGEQTTIIDRNSMIKTEPTSVASLLKEHENITHNETDNVGSNHYVQNNDNQKLKGNNLKSYALIGTVALLTSGLAYQFAKNLNMNNSWDLYKITNKSPYSWCSALNKTNENRINDICIIPTPAQMLDKDFANSYNKFFSDRKDVSLENKAIIQKSQEIINTFNQIKDPSKRLQFTNEQIKQNANNLYQIIETSNNITLKQASDIINKLMNLKQQDNLLNEQANQAQNNAIIAQLEDGNVVNTQGQVINQQGQQIGTVAPDMLKQLQEQAAQQQNASVMPGNQANANSPQVANNQQKTQSHNQQVHNQVQGNAAVATQSRNQGNNTVKGISQQMVQAQPNKIQANTGTSNSIQQKVQQARLPRQNVEQSIAVPQQNNQQDYEYIDYVVQEVPTQENYNNQQTNSNSVNSRGEALERLSFGKPKNKNNGQTINKETNSKSNTKAKATTSSDENDEISEEQESNETNTKRKSSRYYDIRKQKRQEESDDYLNDN